jgi:TetR/AcrR family transcriptional regulator, transcriptional repressor for nem operon
LPYSPEHKAKSREKILQAAADLFCRYGFDAVSLAQVMREASMTHGGFYAHFTSKTTLYAEAIHYAAKHSFLGKMSLDTLELSEIYTLVTQYLSIEHVQQETFACPLAFLSTDVAHRELLVRESYEKTFRGMVNKLSGSLSRMIDPVKADELAQSIVINLVGTVSIARSLTSSDLQRQLLLSTKLSIDLMLSQCK